jgi:hypothetical protein
MRSRGSTTTRRLATTSLIATLVVAVPTAALAAPDNDDRADATRVTAVPFGDLVDVTDATTEDDEPEPSCAPTGQTVWYEVRLDRRTPLVVDTAGSGYDTVAAVYTPDLTEVACNDDAGTLQARVGFSAERGATYLVQIGAYGGVLDPEWDDPTLQVTIERGRTHTMRPRQERWSFQGLQAEAFDWWGDGDSYGGAGVTLVQGRGSDSWSRGQYRLDEVSVYSYDGIVDREKNTETFTDWWGYAPLTSGGIDRKLASASVDQDVEVWGWTCTGPADWEEDEDVEFECTELGQGTVRAAVDWTGVGGTFRSNERSRFQDDWGTYTYRYRATQRQADVAGGVTGDVLSFDLTGAEGYLADVQSSDSFRVSRR